MNLPGITNAAGLDAADRNALNELVEVAQAVEPRNHTLDAYYEGEQKTPDIGIDNIPDSVDPSVRSDWARKAVTSVSERVRMDGFTFAGDYEDEDFGRIELENDLSGAFNRTVASELTHGCMFATVQRVSDRAVVRMHSAESAVATWDVAEQRVGSGLVVADMRRTDWGGLKPVPVQANLHLPGRVVVLRRVLSTSWVAETLPTPLDRPMMEAFCFRPTGTKPFGQTRITRAVRYLVDEVERTLRYMAVSGAFYAVPMMAATGLTDEQFDAMAKSKWLMRVGSWFLATRDEDGNVPNLQQFPGVSPQPYIDAIMTYAKLFSGATGVPLNSLGIVQDNPSSAEAIAAQREDICVAAEDCIESNRASMRNVALMAMAVAGNTTIDGLTDEQRSVIPHFRNPMRPSLASTADAMTKIAAVVDGFTMTREFWAGQGFDTAEVDSILSQVNANRNSAAIMSIMAGGTSGGPGASQQAE
ncbi:hypothetical protein [Thermophilibacter provencensis]|uniref:Portal protein n=1 Tax=Thermophilibacter provencensis TaxID=1852386 RepID=A0ABT7V1S9_9ACTN|nr:hypothetical protein [Thermophilibacter provencensis]MDM8270550.1 hypothetical protein [Thermophilibacter provencensis]